MSLSNRDRALFAQALSSFDEYRTLLRKSLDILSGPQSMTLPDWLSTLEETLHDPKSDSADRLEATAILVGILSIMVEDIGEADARKDPL